MPKIRIHSSDKFIREKTAKSREVIQGRASRERVGFSEHKGFDRDITMDNFFYVATVGSKTIPMSGGT